MNILSIETSTPIATLCLWKNGEICAHSQWQAERNHDAHLFPALQRALACLQGEGVDLILVGAGPGSYGGVRVALAAAAGIAAVKNAQVVSICSWLGLETEGCAIISDAKRGGWTLMQPTTGKIEVLSQAELMAAIEKGLSIVTTEPEEVLIRHGISAKAYKLIPNAEGLIKAWFSLSSEKQDALKSSPAEPIYVRAPHITAAKRKPWEI